MAHSEDIWETEVAIIRLGDLAGIDGLGEHHEHADLNEIAYEFTNEIVSSEIQPRPGTPDGGEGYYLSHIAIAASLLLHLSLTAALLNFEMLGSFTTETPTVVEVRFVADNPLRNTNNEESIPEEELSLEALVQESEVLATAEALLTEVDEVLTQVEEPLENERIDVSNPTIIPQSEQDANEVQALESPAIVHSVVLPFSSSIANILESIESERRSRFYSYDCNRLEEEIGIRRPGEQRGFAQSNQAVPGPNAPGLVLGEHLLGEKGSDQGAWEHRVAQGLHRRADLQRAPLTARGTRCQNPQFGKLGPQGSGELGLVFGAGLAGIAVAPARGAEPAHRLRQSLLP